MAFCYPSNVEKEMRVFKSFAEAEAAEDDYYASMAPEKRLALVFELVAQAYPDEIEQRSERICRIVKLKDLTRSNTSGYG